MLSIKSLGSRKEHPTKSRVKKGRLDRRNIGDRGEDFKKWAAGSLRLAQGAWSADLSLLVGDRLQGPGGGLAAGVVEGAVFKPTHRLVDLGVDRLLQAGKLSLPARQAGGAGAGIGGAEGPGRGDQRAGEELRPDRVDLRKHGGFRGVAAQPSSDA